MTARALLTIATLAVLGGTAIAEKAKVGVLGLEVTGNIDYESTNIAKNLTDELRKQVRNSARFSLATGANKELIDEKVAQGCDSEATACMSKIARKLGAEHLMYGKISKKNKDGAAGYQLELKLLDVDKQSTRPVSLWIPIAETIGSDIMKSASRAYKDAVGEEEVATPLPDPVKPRVGSERGDPAWRKIAIASGVVGLGVGGVHVYYWQKVNKLNDNCFLRDGVYTPESPSNCPKGEDYEKMTKIFLPAALAVGAFTAFATYKGFIAKRDSGERATASGGKRQRKREGFVVTPVVSPGGAGATVRFDW